MLNRVILIGRLVHDPSLKYTTTGIPTTEFVLAVDRPVKGEVDYITIVAWRKLAETCANYLKKGRLTAVEGRLQIRNYDGKEGKKVYVTEIIADNVRFLSGAGPVAITATEESADSADSADDDGTPIDIDDIDLPF